VFKTDSAQNDYRRAFVLVRSHATVLSARAFRAGVARLRRRLTGSSSARSSTAIPAAAVRSRNGWCPGFDGLRSFSKAHELLLKPNAAGNGNRIFLRSHWRMVFPTPKRHQNRSRNNSCGSSARRAVCRSCIPFAFPSAVVNHGMVVYGMTESEREIQFEAYDPEHSGACRRNSSSASKLAFNFPPRLLGREGLLSVIEIYRGGLIESENRSRHVRDPSAARTRLRKQHSAGIDSEM